jgi:hypothetical protein
MRTLEVRKWTFEAQEDSKEKFANVGNGSLGEGGSN